MRNTIFAFVMFFVLALGACTRHESESNKLDARPANEGPEPAARKAGRAAYDITRETEEAAKKAGQKLREASHEAHEGWKEAKQNDKETHRK
jgi:hypothetical protein